MIDTSISIDLPCHRCGYDLRAHPQDGVCPECGASVAEARQWAAIPRRPAWQASDPRWRRRILAGVWVLTLIPLMDLLQKLGWDSLIPAPVFFTTGPATLDNSLLYQIGVYPFIIFCIGAVLLFSKERGRRPSRLDWTRRWGILCTYVVALLSAVRQFFWMALVLVAISAVFIGLPLKNQPGVTRMFGELGAAWLRFGPSPKVNFYCVLNAFSSITVLLACVPLWEALCSAGGSRVAKALLAPLGLFALLNIAQAAAEMIGYSSLSLTDQFYALSPYFRPAVLVCNTQRYSLGFPPAAPGMNLYLAELVKWCIIFAIAVWLSARQLAAYWASPTPLGDNPHPAV